MISDHASGPYVLTKGGGATLGLASTANTFAGSGRRSAAGEELGWNWILKEEE